MKIVTYNLCFGGKAGQRSHWSRIFQALDPDIFLVQETCDPRLYLTADIWEDYCPHIYWAKTGAANWGSAVFVKSGAIKPIAIPELEGYIVGVKVDDFVWGTQQRTLRIFSLHAPAPYNQSVKRMLDIIAMLPSDRNLVIGGDFNLTIDVRHPGELLQDNN